MKKNSLAQLKAILRPIKTNLNHYLDTDYRQREEQQRTSFAQFERETIRLFQERAIAPVPDKTILLVSGEFPEVTKIELAFVETLRMVGYAPVVILPGPNPWIERRYRLWGIEQIVYLRDYFPALPENSAPNSFVPLSFDELVAYQVGGVRVGKYVASSTMRHLRIGSFDPRDRLLWDKLVANIESGSRLALAAAQAVEAIQPDVALFLERGYSPYGQLFDVCIQHGIDVIQWVNAHRDNRLVLKRYNATNHEVHPSTLSAASWEYIKQMPWDSDKAGTFKRELYADYESGQWFNEVGTQYNKRMFDRAQLQASLGLDPSKKTAIIFAHIFWDATFFYGHDLFADYEDWFVQTIRAAIQNPNLNWLVKVHPANVIKQQRDGLQTELSESVAIRKHIGTLPDHVKIIPAETDINTFSLFSLMDYCVTVRGTIGIEASSFGIPVLTAGTGRYDHLGFTIDSESVQEYLQRLSHLQDIPPMDVMQRQLAQRFAYGLFLMRPFALQALLHGYAQDRQASHQVSFQVQTLRELVESPDMRGLAEWVGHSKAEDWLTV